MASSSYDIYISFYAENNILRSEAIALSRFLDILLSGMLNRKLKILLSSDFIENPVFKNREKAAVFPSIKSFLIINTDEYYLNENTINEFALIKANVARKKTATPLIYQIGAVQNSTDNSSIIIPTYRLPFSSKQRVEKDIDYWSTITDLAFELKDIIEPGNEGNRQNSKTTVFLAEADTDQDHINALIKRELLLNGFSILPAFPLPSNELDFITSVRENLQKSDFSVHIFGKQITNVNTAILNRSEIQNNIAVEIATEKNDFNRIIWVDPFLNFDNQDQRLRIQRIIQSRKFTSFADVLQIPVEEFKNILITNLNLKSHKKSEKADVSIPGLFVYLISENKGISTNQSIIELLDLKKISYVEMNSILEKPNSVQLHRKLLTKASSIILFSSSTDSKWMQSMLADITKASGYGRTNEYNYLVAIVPEIGKKSLPLGIPSNFRFIVEAEKEEMTKIVDLISEIND